MYSVRVSAGTASNGRKEGHFRMSDLSSRISKHFRDPDDMQYAKLPAVPSSHSQELSSFG